MKTNNIFYEVDSEEFFGVKKGQKINRLTVLRFFYCYKPKKGGGNQKINYAECQCECYLGTILKVEVRILKSIQIGCGCVRKERVTTHGMKKTKLYEKHNGMMARCYNKNSPCYHSYGGRGITVCEPWHKFENFMEWALKNGFENHLTIERKNVHKNYCPENCCFIPGEEQPNNTTKSVWIEIYGENKTAISWSRDPRCLVRYDTFLLRIKKKWNPSEALTTPSKKTKITIDNETKYISDWMQDARCSVSRNTISERIKMGWSMKDTVFTPPYQLPLSQQNSQAREYTCNTTT